jgi:hypothetical protein
MWLDFLFKDTDVSLMDQQSFSGSYQLTTKSCFVMGSANPPIHLSSIADIDLTQIVKKKKISTTVSFVDMVCETDHNNFKESIQEMQLFAKINPVIEIQRDEKGKMKRITNMERIRQDWEYWKKEKLPLSIPDERKQKKIINNYENGLKLLEYQFDTNFQYNLLLPECYKFKDYVNPQDITSVKSYPSRFIEKLEILYYLKKRTFSVKKNIVKFTLDSRIFSQESAIKNKLISFYNKFLSDFSYLDYLFEVKTEYTFDKNTSEIMDAKLFFVERLHANFVYTLELSLVKKDRENKSENIQETISFEKKI